jgi:hypothetical protein
MTSIELPEHLATIAEVAVAFTGFAGIVSVLGRSSLDPKVRFWRVQLIVMTSLSAMFGALVPSALQLLVSDGDALWRISSLILLLLVAGQLAVVYRSMPSEQASGPLRMFYSPMSVVLTVGSLLCQVGLASVVVGTISTSAPALYFLTLLFLLLASAFHFLRLLKGAQPDAPYSKALNADVE